MSIWIIEGLPRHGKSTFATQLVIEWVAHYIKVKKPPRRIIANFPIHLPGVELIEDFMDIKDASNAIIILDEAAQYFSGHDSKANSKLMSFFRQHGKEGLTIYLIAHSYADLDVTIRERTAEGIWRVKRLFGPTRWEETSGVEKMFGMWAYAQCYQSRDYGTATKRHKLGARFIRLDLLHGKFDTLCRVGTLAEGKNGRGAGLAAGGLVAALPEGPGVLVAQDYDVYNLRRQAQLDESRRLQAQAAGAQEAAGSGQPKLTRDMWRRGVVQADPFGVTYRYQGSVDDAIEGLFAADRHDKKVQK